MSINRNRAKLNKATNGRTYHIEWLKELYPTYWDENYSWKCNDFPNHKRRSYKTWKHTRRTQWKQ